MKGIGSKLGVALICGSLLLSSSAANAAAPASAANSGQWLALSAMGTSASAAAVSTQQANPQIADPHGYGRSGHGLGPSVGLLGLAILLAVLVIALAHDDDDEEGGSISPD